MPNAKTPKTLLTDQLKLLLSALRADDRPHKTFLKGVRNYLIGSLMLDAGLRVGELVALKMSHLYFAGVPVRQLLLSGDITKNKKERTVPINERLKAAMLQHFEVNPWLINKADNYSVWGTAKSDIPLTTRQVENILNKAAMKSLGRLVNPHMLRHCFGSSLMRITNIRTVQELLGHSQVTSTQIYTHPNEEDKQSAIDDLEEQTKLLGKDLESLAGLG